MANPGTKPVKVLTDLLTKKQIIKKDGNDVLFNVSGTLAAGGHVSSSLPLTASAGYFEALNVSSSSPFLVQELSNLVSNDRYNVDAAIHEIDKAIKKTGITDAVRAAEAVNAYKRLRYQCTGAFDAEGYAEVKLPLTMSNYDYPTLVGPNDAYGFTSPPVFENGAGAIDAAGEDLDPNFQSFPASSIDYINLDVMVRDCEQAAGDTTVTWTNDILAVNLIVSGAANDELWVRLWAPEFAGQTEVKYRLLATNEDPSLYVIR